MKKIIRDSFEQLGDLGKTTAKQAAQQTKKMAEEVVSVAAGKKSEQRAEPSSGGSGEPRNPKGFGRGFGSQKPKLTQAQIAEKIEKAAQMRSKLHLQEIEGQIAEIQRQRLEQVKQVQEEAFKQEELREELSQEAQLPSKRKKGLMPISVKRLKQKVEGWRGAKG